MSFKLDNPATRLTGSVPLALMCLTMLGWPVRGSPQTATDLDCVRCVDTGHLSPGSVQAGRIANEAIRSRHLRDGLIDTSKLRDGAVDSAKLDDGAVGEQQLSQGLVGRLNDLESPPDLGAGAATVLDLSTDAGCQITEGGFYVLDRNWYLGPVVSPEPLADWAEAGCVASEGSDPAANDPFIRIDAFIWLDLRGFTLSAASPYLDRSCCDVIGVAAEQSATIQHGVVRSNDVAVRGFPGSTVRLINIAGTVARIDQGVVTHSSFAAGVDSPALSVGSEVEVTFSSLRCGETACITANGINIEIRSNRLSGNGGAGVLLSQGAEVAVTHNLLINAGIGLNGNDHFIAHNIVSGDLISTNGGGNVVEANVVLNPSGTGIRFQQDGNFYGNNRVSAQTPFDLGGTTQTDWGGNVSF